MFFGLILIWRTIVSCCIRYRWSSSCARWLVQLWCAPSGRLAYCRVCIAAKRHFRSLFPLLGWISVAPVMHPPSEHGSSCSCSRSSAPEISWELIESVSALEQLMCYIFKPCLCHCFYVSSISRLNTAHVHCLKKEFILWVSQLIKLTDTCFWECRP